VALNDASYVLDASARLHRVDSKTSTEIDHDVHGIAGEGELLLVCRKTRALDIVRNGVVVARGRCAQTKSMAAMAVVGDDYAVISDEGTLHASRGGKPLELSTGIRGEYELVLSSRGVLGTIDYAANGKTWFVRPGGERLEPGPAYASQPLGLAADGNLVAWGYADGAVIAIDVMTGMRWELHGHRDAVGYLVIDAANARLISASRREVRTWDVKPAPSTLIATMPCSSFHIELSPDATQAAIDCNDGAVRIWSRQTGALTKIQNHNGYSFGLRWVRGMICSGGWGDGQVQCSSPEGAPGVTLESRGMQVMSLSATPDGNSLVFAVEDGTVWRFDGSLRELYAHAAPAYRTAISADGRLLASCADDGSLAVYDLVSGRLKSHLIAHTGARGSVSWVGDELWSTGEEGTLKRWSLRDGELRLRHMVQASAGLRRVKVVQGAWAAAEGAVVLLVSRDGASIALRIDTGRSITALDVSADQRYVAAGIDGEIIVIDFLRSSIATLATGAPVQQLSFLEPALIAFSEPAALKTLRVDQLEYVPFELTPEPPNRASF
jgi:WD40 repeat protein